MTNYMEKETTTVQLLFPSPQLRTIQTARKRVHSNNTYHHSEKTTTKE